MEIQSDPQESLRGVTATCNLGLGDVICKCGEGWTCVITRTHGPYAGKTFFKCAGNCTCVIDGDVDSKDSHLPPDVVKTEGSKAFCRCGKGWSCVISKVEGPDAGKAFSECAEGCTCVIDA
ncbi:Succinate dehydrogenase [ubiquinone] iron-sulfur subunit, mitochondrial [Quillaja saponaria]|uniref:Succinate dehydrogenase [ubiquinone] iron-sulfur subunit, mitochondrial n=1 Tax=Quillaja saponaria TaxID=32244 RepID=A0AAD7L8Q6_QUISA|nr:Succinate dehydrogenase [ubiquinone] iron-sulfur subunit, mitochondrial [Quillaja saponaria]